MLAVIILCLLLEGYFSGTEVAILSINKLKLMKRLESKDRAAMKIMKFLENPERLFGTTLVGTNLMVVTSSSLAAAFALKHFGREGSLVSTAVMSVLILLFGEIIPKTIYRYYTDRISYYSIYVLETFYYIFYPLGKTVTMIVRGIVKLTGTSVGDHLFPFTRKDELQSLIEDGDIDKEILHDERNMISGVFEFGDTKVKEAMVPRINMISMDVEATLEDLFNKLPYIKYSRIPVYQDSVDNIVGIIYTKDLIRFWKLDWTKLNVIELIRIPLFVPKTMRLDDLFRKFQKEKVHMAIVVDEYGGTSGLITMEDLLEEIVGEIQDEHDREPPFLTLLDEKSILVDARLEIEKLEDHFGITLPRDSYESVGGFIIHLLGRIPNVGEKVMFDRLEMTIKSAGVRKIEEIVITDTTPSSQSGEARAGNH